MTSTNDILVALEKLVTEYTALKDENARLRKERDALKERRKNNWERLKETTPKGAAYAICHVYKSEAPADLIAWFESYEGFDDTWFGAKP